MIDWNGLKLIIYTVLIGISFLIGYFNGYFDGRNENGN